TLAVALVAALVPLLAIKLPPPVEKAWAWRGAIVAAVIVLPALLLLAQLSLGFGLEQMVKTTVEAPKDAKQPDTFEGRLKASARTRQVARATLERTFWLDLAVLFQFLALAGAGLDAWVQHRSAIHPPPRLDVMW